MLNKVQKREYNTANPPLVEPLVHDRNQGNLRERFNLS